VREIVEFSGPDYTGKSTQADLLAMETLGTHVHNFASFEGYGAGIPEGLTPSEHFVWWFERTTIEDMADVLTSAYLDREEQARRSSIDLAVYERGRTMMRAQLAANFATRDDANVADYIEQSTELIDQRLMGLATDVKRTEVMLLPDAEWLASQEDNRKHARTQKTSASVFTDYQNEFYAQYLANLNEAITIIGEKDQPVTVRVDGPAVDVNNHVRSLEEVYNGALPQLLPQDPTILGFAGLSESGKSRIAELLAAEHGFTRLKLGFFNERGRDLESAYARPKQMAMDVLHFVATNRHLRLISFESLHGAQMSAELKLLMGERWKPVFITLDEEARLQRLIEQFPEADAAQLIEEQARKDSTKRNAGVEAYAQIADIIVNNNGTPQETVGTILKGLNMDSISESFNDSPERDIPELVTRLEASGYEPDPEERPRRCRAIIFNPDGTKVLGIVRQRPGREAYAVYPGGGIEDEDVSALDAIRRELSEELGLASKDVALRRSVLRFEDEVGGDQFYYLGVASEEFAGLAIQGPEAGRDPSVSGTYDPQWIPVEDLIDANFQPEEVAQMILAHQ